MSNMKTSKKRTRFIIAALLMFCTVMLVWGFASRSTLLPGEYKKWIENPAHGLNLKQDFSNVSFHLLYKPVEYIINNNYKKEVDEKTLDKEKQELEGSHYFTLRIKNKETNKDVLLNGIESEQDYFSRLDYYSFEAQMDIALIQNNDTMNCTMMHMVKTDGLAPYIDLLVGFDYKEVAKPLEGDLKFVMYDRIFGNGKVEFIIERKNILKAPLLTSN